MLTIIDEYSRACLATETRRKLTSQDVLHVLGKLFLHHGPPEHIRSDNGPGFVAQAVREWLGAPEREDTQHRARITVGERISRELQGPPVRPLARRQELIQC